MKPGDIDVSRLPDHAFGHRSMVWWGTLAFVVIEAAVFAVLIASYLYGAARIPDWPPRGQVPGLLFGILNTAILLASCWPNQKYKSAAEREDLRGSRIWLLVAIVFGLAFAVVRALEFTNLNVRWDDNFYGSILWTLLGFHTIHILTDLADTIVLAVLIFKKPVGGKRFSDLSDNGMYWYFVVIAWLPFFALIYVAPYLN